MARYLKTIELDGFKSFGVKTAIECVDGITGIVGANGSGKSNVIEAIKWVLGEQSAKSLRGEKMEDIIFNGTHSRSPKSMAEVTLTFDNTNKWLPLDFEEVSIGRRIFRSGEGQYFINKSRVRLKDVVELFLDTGIGRDSYAIFEQGKIDRLLSESPEERRYLFEEFAGISKFKFRREEAEKKLEAAQANLARVQDIIIELEKDCVKLEKQAENAALYNTLKQELMQGEILFEVLRIQNMQQEILAKTQEKQKIESQIFQKQEKLTEYEEALLTLDNDLMDKEKKQNEWREIITSLEKTHSAYQTEIKSSRERKILLEKQLESLVQRLKEGEGREIALREEYERKQQSLVEIEELRDIAREKLTTIQTEIDRIRESMRLLDQQLLQKSRELGFSQIVTRDHVDRLNKEIFSLDAQQENTQRKLEELFRQKQAFEAETSTKRELLEELIQKRKKLETEVQDISAQIQQNLKEENGLKKENQSLLQSIQNLQQKLKSVDKIIIESLEKQAQEIKAFSQKKPFLEANLRELFSRIEQAITDSDLSIVAQLLKQLQNLFQEIQSSYEEILAILYSEEGTYTQKERIQQNIEEITQVIEDNRQKIELLQERLRELQTLRENTQASYSRVDYETQSLEEEIKKIENQQNSIEEAYAQTQNAFNLLRDRILEKQEQLEKLIQLIEDYEHEVAERKITLNRLLDELNNQRVETVRVEEQYKSLSTELQRIKLQLEDIQKTRTNYTKDLENSLAVIEELDHKIDEAEEKLTAITAELEKARNTVAEIRSQVEALLKERKTLESLRRDLEQEITHLEKRLGGMENAIQERQTVQQNIIKNLEENYHCHYTDIHPPEGVTIENLHEKIVDIKKQIDALGNVNLLAIDEFRNAKERLEFLQRERQDSEKAMQDIIHVIEETNEKSKELFLSSFEDIRKSFRKVFARMFDGGRADLILVDENDVLNSGINIMAEPPGKKFQAISLLSGGERALVAISVIFAILHLKPTPFVVLDEMDAPLDDDNIERFKRLLLEFKEVSQFIIVSHSKSTLEICDALYGVTMEEQGVSKVVSVAFDEAASLLVRPEETE
ncbi:chromosome segregation SMC family protein [Thermospira aquatica]|uniref:Chromosome partition protein Smc n=1 Tax=Thermospira aquatica TaxID=2828656 RepID=A0AAX3BFS2_9SPIR|nr:AAA family ATPase [Thermospira aquatica]URA11020.1 AAA family ATPase [Thermospira aquatica]